MTNMNLVKVGGICAILIVAFTVVAIILSVASGVEENPDEIQTYLQNALNNAMYSAYGWFWLVGLALVIPAALGFYQALREAGRLSLPALAFFLVGLATAFASVGLFLGIERQLVPSYAAAGGAMKPTLEVVASTLLESATWGFGLGFFISFGIGTVLFSIGVLRTSVIRRWIGWLGVVAGILMVCLLLATLSDVLDYIAVVALVLVLVWTAAMGVSLLRLREAAA